MSQHEYDQAPATLQVRECEAGGKIFVPTFRDPKQTPKDVLKAFFRQRWHVELDLRNIKTPLGTPLRPAWQWVTSPRAPTAG